MALKPTDLLAVHRGTTTYKAEASLLKTFALDGEIIRSATAPTSPPYTLNHGTIWVDSSKNPPELHAWDTTANAGAGGWKAVGGGGGGGIGLPPGTLPGVMLVADPTNFSTDTQKIEFSVNGGAFADTASATAGQLVRFRWKATAVNADAHGASVTETVHLMVGTKDTTEAYTVTVDKLPGAININAKTNVNAGVAVESDSSTVVGEINAPARIWLASTDGTVVEASVSGAVWTAVPATAAVSTLTVSDGQTIKLRHTTKAGASAATTTVVRVGWDATNSVAVTYATTNAATKAPVINTVTLADVAGGNRFTNTQFPVSVTMTEDGVPASAKKLKAHVDGKLLVSPVTDTIVTVTPGTGPNLTSAAGWTGTSLGKSDLPTQTVNKFYKLATDPSVEPRWSVLQYTGNDVDGQTMTSMPGLGRPYDVERTGLLCFGTDWCCAYVGVGTVNQVYMSNNGTSFQGSIGSPGTGNMVGSQAIGGNVGLFSAGSGANWLKRVEKGASSVSDVTTEQNASSGGCRFALTRDDVWFIDGFGGAPEISTDGGRTFHRIVAQPSWVTNNWWLVNGEVWFFNPAQTEAWATTDFHNGRHITGMASPPFGNLGLLINGLWYCRGRDGGGSYSVATSWDRIHWAQWVTGSGPETIFQVPATAPKGLFSPDATVYMLPNTTIKGKGSPTVISLSGSTSLSILGIGDSINEQTVAGAVGDASGIITSINAGANTISVYTAAGTWDIGNKIAGAPRFPAGGATARMYCSLDATGTVTNLRSTDPGFTTWTSSGSGTGPYTGLVKFPATLPTGNAPDADLPAGTTITVEVEASNSTATVSKASNTVTPT